MEKPRLRIYFIHSANVNATINPEKPLIVYDKVSADDLALSVKLNGKELPETDYSRCFVIISKVKNTPKKFPRLNGKATKYPL